MVRPWPAWSLPTMGILFSAWQAMTQALQPVQTLRSTVMPHCCAAFIGGVVEIFGERDRDFSATGGFFHHAFSSPECPNRALLTCPRASMPKSVCGFHSGYFWPT